MKVLHLLLPFLIFLGPLPADEKGSDKEKEKEKEKKDDPLATLKLPGVAINLAERAVDVQATIALAEGSLEFVACLKNTKEHESVLSVQAKPSNIHTALLLLGAKAGHPAIRKVVGDGDQQRWLEFPPEGSPISVSVLVTKDGKQVEHPLTDFIRRSGEEATKTETRLKTFLFAGSHLQGEDQGPRTYLADKSGSVISLSTFGDELLCLPGFHGHENSSLQWEINPTHLPKVGTRVLLRLRPRVKTQSPDK